MQMFKKICVLLFLLLVVFLSVISVNASNELQTNETEVEYITNTDKSIDVSIDDKLSDNNEMVVDTNITLSLQQGEHIELVFFNKSNIFNYEYCINDNSIYCVENFSDDGWHVYVPINAIDFNAVNVGMNTLTVKYHGYPSIVEKVSSNLIQFKRMDLNKIQYYGYYSYNFNLNITKKQEKTINIINVDYNVYGGSVFFKLYDIDEFLFKGYVRLILYNNEKIYYDGFMSAYNHMDDTYFCYLDLLYDYNIIIPPGVYNLTIINYDGTNDTYQFEFKKLAWNLDFGFDSDFGYYVRNDAVLFYFDGENFIYSPYFYSDYNITIKLGNITKSISSNSFNKFNDSWGSVNVLFDNLDDGVYDVVIEIPGNDFVEDFLFTTQIEIKNKQVTPDNQNNTNGTNSSSNSSNDEGDIIMENDIINRTDLIENNITSDSDGNSSILSLRNSSGSNLSNISGSGGQEHFKESNDVDFNNEHVSDYGDLELTGSIRSADNAKSYEISKNQKNEDENSNNEYYLALMFFIFFMIGFFRFKRVYY